MSEINTSRPANLQRSHPPEAWIPARQDMQKLLAPVERFLHIEASSGILLMIAAAAALVWANSPWRAAYADLWHIPIGFQFGGFGFERDLHFWINDGLMTIFFFVVGLEIRREIHAGELSQLRRATLPLAAALGGMLAPAVIYLALNSGRSSSNGWAIPMATDIAFAVGVLALLGNRVAPALRILLLALAVIDDVGAIVVIALFYSSGLSLGGLALAAAGIAATYVMQGLGIRSPLAYVAPAIVIWGGAYAGGIHPTLAGVVVGFMTPVRAWFGPEQFLSRTLSQVHALHRDRVPAQRDLLPHLERLKYEGREAVSPLDRLQYLLHGWVAFGVMPLFAFANAGVPLGAISFEGDAWWVFLGVAIGLAVGKPIGILGLSWCTARAGAAVLPRGIRWRDVSIVGVVGGIGFTMALFIAQLAFPQGQLLETAKLAILCGSGVAGIAALAAGARVLKPSTIGATSEAQAEASTSQ